MVTIGTRKVGDRYVGVLRNGRTELATCGHETSGHVNRDVHGRGGPAARECMTQLVRATALPALRASLVERARNAWRTLGQRGFQVPTSTVDRARSSSEQDAASVDQHIGTLAELLAEHDTTVQLVRSSGGTRLVPLAR